jgi:hypothetical protein
MSKEHIAKSKAPEQQLANLWFDVSVSPREKFGNNVLGEKISNDVYKRR